MSSGSATDGATDLVIFGAASQARLARYYFETDSPLRPVAFTVDREFCDADAFDGLPLVPFDDVVERYPPDRHRGFVALGYTDMNRVRAAKFEQMRAVGYDLASYVSSRCTYLAPDPPGANAFVLEDNTVQPFVRVGENVTLWSGNHIGHDAVIGDHVFVTSHVVISGFTRIGDHCFLGVNSTFRDDITVAEGTLVGAGASITKDTDPWSVWLPPRATRLDKRSDELSI